MAVNVHVHTTHRQFTNGLEVVGVEGHTVGECLNHLVKQFPAMEKAGLPSGCVAPNGSVRDRSGGMRQETNFISLKLFLPRHTLLRHCYNHHHSGRYGVVKLRALLVFIVIIGFAVMFTMHARSQTQVTLNASKDNTLYRIPQGA